VAIGSLADQRLVYRLIVQYSIHLQLSAANKKPQPFGQRLLL